MIDNMTEAMGRLTAEIRAAEAKITNAVHQTIATIDDHRRLFVAPRPDLAAATPGNVLSEDFLGHSLHTGN